MTISQLSYPLLSKRLTLLFLPVVPTACSTEENVLATEAVASAAGNNASAKVADPDFKGDLIVNSEDLVHLKATLSTANPDADTNGKRTVNAQDLAIPGAMFFRPPAPVPAVNRSVSLSTINQRQSATLSWAAESYR